MIKIACHGDCATVSMTTEENAIASEDNSCRLSGSAARASADADNNGAECGGDVSRGQKDAHRRGDQSERGAYVTR